MKYQTRTTNEKVAPLVLANGVLLFIVRASNLGWGFGYYGNCCFGRPPRFLDLFPSLFERNLMLYWAVIFFIVAIVAGIFGFGGLANDTAYIAKILAIVGIILALISFLTYRGRSRR